MDDVDLADFEDFQGLSQCSAVNNLGIEMLQMTSQLENVFEAKGAWNTVDYGQEHPDWINFLSGIKSADAYRKVVEDFLIWQHENFEDSTSMETRLKQYMQVVYELTKEDGSKKYAANKFRPMLSVFMQFWLFSG